MKCRQIMKALVACISPTGTAELAAQRMNDSNVGFLPVCDDDARVLGALTDRDIAIRIVAKGRSALTPVCDIMTPDAVFCRPDDDIEVAEGLMAEHQKSRILCCDDDLRLVGVISLSDLAKDDPPGATRTLGAIAAREASRQQ
jgi:CBS-domain-containing membrane protein